MYRSSLSYPLIHVFKNHGKTFQALSSTVRRNILAYLSHSDLTAGKIAEKFEMTKPSLSKHLSILENAGLIVGEKKG
jgi:DNA-binding transcriptional ArsR family regulator